MSWTRFVLAMTPVVMDVLRDLYRLTRGDVEKSKVAIRRIRDHGYRLDQVEAEVDARIQAVREREKQ